jgi:isoleucyl-tRNA synthetase
VPYEKRPEIDRWIISRLNSLIGEYTELMDNYDITKAARAVSEFTIDHLSNWYVRRCRRRFWKSEMNENKLSAYQTLYECLIKISKLVAPFSPFIAEELFQNLNAVTGKENTESVHLSEFPEPGHVEKGLEVKMEIAQKVVYLTRAMRAKSNLKVRQPLSKIMVVVESSQREALRKMQDVILDEVNIKKLVILDNDSGIVSKSAKANFKSIGPKFGKRVNPVANAIKELGEKEISELDSGKEISIEVSGEQITITQADVEIVSSEIKGWVVESEEGVTVAIDTELNDKLKAEGLAREFVNRVQNMRKDSGFEVTDKIEVKFNASEKIIEAINSFKNYISNEILAKNILNVNSFNGNSKQEWTIGDYQCTIQIERANS